MTQKNQQITKKIIDQEGEKQFNKKLAKIIDFQSPKICTRI